MYTTQANIEAALGRSLSDTELTFFDTVLKDAIDKYIDNKTETTFGSADSVTVFASGEGTDMLIIPTMNTITAVQTEDGTAIDTGSYVQYPMRGDERFAIRLKDDVWEMGLENYRVLGKMGYKNIPADITSIATEIASNVISGLKSSQMGYKSEKTGDWSATYLDGERSLSMRSIDSLCKYRRLSRMM